jgi:hypothetical protein
MYISNPLVSSVWQCAAVRRCAAVLAAVFGSACGSGVRQIECGSVRRRARQRVFVCVYQSYLCLHILG